MLVLSRRFGEAIVLELADSRQVRVIADAPRRSGDDVALVIDAPRDVGVRRAETLQQSRAQALAFIPSRTFYRPSLHDGTSRERERTEHHPQREAHS